MSKENFFLTSIGVEKRYISTRKELKEDFFPLIEDKEFYYSCNGIDWDRN